jgi:hypothetical protein
MHLSAAQQTYFPALAAKAVIVEHLLTEVVER